MTPTEYFSWRDLPWDWFVRCQYIEEPPGPSGPPRRSGRATEGRGVLNRREGGAERVVVRPRRRGLDIGDRDGDLDVGESAGEEPEVPSQGTSVEHLEGHFDIRGAEEP